MKCYDCGKELSEYEELLSKANECDIGWCLECLEEEPLT